MRKKYIGSALIILLTISVFCSSFSESTVSTSSKADWYREGQEYMKLKMYAEAVDAFTRAGNYEQNSTTVMLLYCQGMVLLEKADELEKSDIITKEIKEMIVGYLDEAEDLFSGIEYEDSAKMSKYIKARKFEVQGLSQPAIDIYGTLFDTYDSHKRYRNLVFSSDNIIHLIEAQVNKKTKSYAGPGSEIYKSEPYIISPEMPVSIVGQNGEWYLVETQCDDTIVRVWVPKIRIQRKEPTEPSNLNGTVVSRINNQSEVFYGPGPEYLKMNITLQPGASVTVMGADGEYSLVEFINTADKMKVCGWVESSNINKK